MKKKTNARQVIRQIVREEVAMAIQEVIIELKQPSLSPQQVSQPKPEKKIVDKKEYSKNSVINNVLNETAVEGEWKNMGEGAHTTGKMNEVIASQYGDLMNGGNEGGVNADAMIASMGTNPDKVSKEVKDNMFNKDYRSLMKKVEEKSKQKRGM